jgi:hypothetical protein
MGSVQENPFGGQLVAQGVFDGLLAAMELDDVAFIRP